jgi:hypothetical protein
MSGMRLRIIQPGSSSDRKTPPHSQRGPLPLRRASSQPVPASRQEKARPVENVTTDEFFAALAETDDAAKFKALEQTLKKT